MLNKLNKRIVFTGGHHNSALAVAMELKKKGCEVFWLGHKYSMWGDNSPAAEYREVTATGIQFFELKAGKLYRTYNPLKLLRIFWGFIEAFKCLRLTRPDIIVSFGGYLAVPVVIVGWFLGIPAITHEQTSVSGLSNQLIGRFARVVLLTYDTSKSYFPQGKVKVIGLPLPESFFRYLKVHEVKKKRSNKAIFITGGKQGSHVINKKIMPVIGKLVRKYEVIHQTGSSTLFRDFAAAGSIRDEMNVSLRSRYKVVDYLSGDDNWKAWFHAETLLISLMSSS